MPYQVKINAPGESWIEDPVFSTEQAADDYGLQCMSEAAEGAEVLNLSNPGDYDSWEYQAAGWDFKIIEVD